MNLRTAINHVIGTPNRAAKRMVFNDIAKKNILLTKQLARIQATTDPTTNTDSTITEYYRGTPSNYATYTAQVSQLSSLYDNLASWGCMVAKNVIDVRTAFSVGQGVQVKKRDGYKGSAQAELDWAKEFMRFNNLDEEMPQEYAKEAEIEGKILLRYLVDVELGRIRVLHVPWRKYNYKITTPSYDFFDYTNAKYDGTPTTGVAFDLPSMWFVYRRFGGSASQVNDTPPKTTFVLRQIEDLDKAIWDWRKINRIFAAPTPVISCADAATAKEINVWVDNKNWIIGDLLILGGVGAELNMVGWKGDGHTTLKEETQALVKTISGTTGVPVHFLGYPELLSNRDTADNLIELIALSTNKERRTWVGAYEEVIQKGMALNNLAFGTTLDPMALDVIIPFITAARAQEIASLYLPMYAQGALSLSTLLSQISGEIDVDEEIIRVKAEQATKDAKQKEVANAAIHNSKDTGSKSE